jgi:hypothetical protein
MYILAISLIGFSGAFSCWAMVFLLLDNRKRTNDERSFRESLDEIDHQLRRARRERSEL